MPVPTQEHTLEIIPTDLRFFHDSFFEESRRHFEMAVKEITDKYGLSSKDPLSSYRSLRQKELKTDNQAISVTDEVNARKFVIDVKDFKDGELSVKVVDNSVVAEGRVERRESGSSSTHSFRRRFSLPKSVELESITSTISSDGILTITAPKKKQQQTISEKKTSLNCKGSTSAMNTVKSSTTNVIKTASNTESHKINKQDISTQTNTRTPSPKLDIGKEVPNTDKAVDTKEDEPETPLPLILRGSFFDDSFFSHAHRDFEAAIESILRSHDINGSSVEARKKYRSLRKDKLVDETQAVTLSEDDTYHKILSDVQDFKDGDVQVKGVGRSLVVEGRVEKISDGSVSSQSFRRRFSLPSQAQLSDVTAALSSDGILTVLVKKNSETHKEDEVSVPIQIVDKTEHRRNETNSCKQKTDEDIKVSDTLKLQKDSQISKKAPNEAPVLAKPQDTKKEEGSFPEELHQQKKQSIVAKEQEKRVEVCKESKATTTQKLAVQHQETATQSQSVKEKTTATTVLQSERTTPPSKYFPLPVESRGDFFQDSFFENDHKHFESAVSKVLERFGMKSSTDDDLKSYRTLRKSISVEESQAVQISNEETKYKVVMDMRDIVGGDVKVKADGQKLVVEGRSEKKEGNSASSRSFRRCFTFPTLVDMEAVTSALSSDGVLTITAPKRRNSSVCQKGAEHHDKEESLVSSSHHDKEETLVSCPSKVSGGLSTTKRSTKTITGWTEQSSYHESSFHGKINQETSSESFQSSSTSRNIA